MRVSLSSALCDAVELGALEARKLLSLEDLLSELTTGVPDDQVTDILEDALGVAAQRAACCGEGYPFEVSERTICAKAVDHFSPYLFLLLGCSLNYSGARQAPTLTRRFRKYFEDFALWSLRSAGITGEVISEPRAERGLPRSLRPALVELASRLGERAELLTTMLTADDNDLGVDVVATFPLLDMGRSGRPIFLLQCATGPVERLESKLAEKQNVFTGVWQWGFYSTTAIRAGATPHDLLRLDPVFWDRLCKEGGWVLDRVRLVQLAHCCGADAPPTPSGLRQLWQDLLSAAPELDWRNGWRECLRENP